MSKHISQFNPRTLFAVLSVSLLVLAWLWHLPMIMYDHLDLVPVLERFGSGDLSFRQLMEWHGGHSHAAAYLVLLVTTLFSDGLLMADIFVSWIFLILYSALMCLCVWQVAGHSKPAQSRNLLIMTIFMTLTTLHLPNLIWGWQVAVFINLCGLALGVCAVCLHMGWTARLLMGGLGIILALSSFATGAALLPAMLLGLILRHSISRPGKLLLAGLWSVLFAWLLYRLHYISAGINPEELQIGGILHYAANYLGGGVVRFATVFSIPVFIFATIMLLLSLGRLYRESRTATALWSMIAAFAIGAALLTAYGRYDSYGANQAWVIRYGSFASLYWFAVLGAFLSLQDRSRLLRHGFNALVFMFAFNSLHFVPQTHDFYMDARALEESVLKDWPNVSPEVLAVLYPSDPAKAGSGLRYLHDKAYPPFHAELTQPD